MYGCVGLPGYVNMCALPLLQNSTRSNCAQRMDCVTTVVNIGSGNSVLYSAKLRNYLQVYDISAHKVYLKYRIHLF